MNSILDPTDTEPKNYLELMPENLRDPEALAKSKYHADTHIKTLEMKMDELRNDYLKLSERDQTAAKLEDLIRRLENPPQQLTSSAQPIANEVREPKLDLNELDKRFDQRLTQFELQRKEQANANTVKDKLIQRFGDKYADAVKQQINDLGWSEEDFNAMARKSPAAALKTLGVDDTRGDIFQAPPRGNSNFGNKADPVKDFAYYQTMKKENPKLYHNPKITNEMTQQAEIQGPAFFARDYASDKDMLKARFG